MSAASGALRALRRRRLGVPFALTQLRLQIDQRDPELLRVKDSYVHCMTASGLGDGREQEGGREKVNTDHLLQVLHLLLLPIASCQKLSTPCHSHLRATAGTPPGTATAAAEARSPTRTAP